jgi:uncharacterized cupin superfamily protein
MSTPTTKLQKHGDSMRGPLAWVGTDYAGLTIQSLTTTQRDALSPTNGAMIYNTTTAQFELRQAGAWLAFSPALADSKDSVQIATTANVTLSGEQTIDGVLTSASRILVKNQTAGADNGIYVTASGAWARATDFDTSAEVTAGASVFISEGTDNGNSTWQLTTNDAITLGSTALVFAIAAGSFPVTASRAVVSDVDGYAAASAVTAAELGYVSGATSGLQAQIDTLTTTHNAIDWKQSVQLATTANVTLSGEQTIDGVLTSASRILVKNQTAGADNGIYVTAAGAWSRATDFDTSAEVTAGASVFISEGTDNGNEMWQLTTNDAITLGSTALVFAQIGGSGILEILEDTSPQLGGMLDVNGNAIGDGTLELVKFAETASAVNEVSIANAATGGAPTLYATGDDTNIDLKLSPKGTGNLNVLLGKIAIDGTVIAYVPSATTGTLIIGDGATSITANYVTGVGFGALAAVTTGAGSTAIGYQALATTTGGVSTAVGYQAMQSAPGFNCTAIGYQALLVGNLRGVAVGHQSMVAATGDDNTAVGYKSAVALTVGKENTAIGSNAFALNTTGNENTAVGFNAMANTAAVTRNTAVGKQALWGSTGAECTAVGWQAAILNTSGNYNTAIGATALRHNISGDDNTAVGFQALYRINASNNTGLGTNAGHFITGGVTEHIAGTSSVFIGDETRAAADTETNQIVIGSGATGAGSNSATLGNASVTKTVLRGAVDIAGTVELGHATDTTLSRASAGVVAVEGVALVKADDAGMTDARTPSDVTLNAQVGTAYTLVLTDKNKVVTMDNASANVLTVPPNSAVAFPNGSQITVIQKGDGETSFAAGAGVTINSEAGELKLNAKFAAASLIKEATDTWYLIGSLKA